MLIESNAVRRTFFSLMEERMDVPNVSRRKNEIRMQCHAIVIEGWSAHFDIEIFDW
jgi:hypothetical protein